MSPVSGGKIPFDPATALAGPARVLYAPLSAAVPDDLWDIVSPIAVSGEYPVVGSWLDFGLAADAPTYSHSRDTEGLEYEHSAGVLFETLSDIARTFSCNIAQIEPSKMAIVENSSSTEATVAAAAGKSAQKRMRFGSYSSLQSYRIALISFRPEGSAEVTEPGGLKRPPAVGLVLPRVVLGAEDSEFTFGRGEPVSANIAFNVIAETTLVSGEEHGFWVFEQPGVIAP